MKRPMVTTVLLGLTLLSRFGAPAGSNRNAQLELRLYVGKGEFFEQEPIYAVFELSNHGLDTAWISPFGITYPALTPVLTSGAGSAVPRLIGVTDYVPPLGWRGVPIAPGDRLYDTTVLQDWWGEGDSAARGLFIRHLSPGSYDLSATFNSEVGPDAGRSIEAQPVHFSIHGRTAGEEPLYREVKALTGMVSDRDQRPRYLGALLAWVSTRLSAKDAGNPYRLASLRAAVAEAQRSLPAGAYAVDAGYADRPELVPPLARALGQSLAGGVAAQREKEHRSEARPRQ